MKSVYFEVEKIIKPAQSDRKTKQLSWLRKIKLCQLQAETWVILENIFVTQDKLWRIVILLWTAAVEGNDIIPLFYSVSHQYLFMADTIFEQLLNIS
jgi:hypothetical protein